MKTASKLAATALLGLSLAGATAGAASAAVACNNDGVCWHVRPHYNYHRDWGVTVHPDNWRWGANDHYRWREHRGRGYWRDGHWVRF